MRRLFMCACVFLTASAVCAADWPMYRHDAHRSGITDESLSVPLRKVWVYQSARPPAPAWPPQPKLLNRTDYDYAMQVVVAGGLVCFGSSTDDTVRALDLNTGKKKWHFTAGGPVRFAPQIEGGKVYFASDDGRVYCLDLKTGKRVWTRRVAPWADRMLGNGRMISRWPCRTGVLVKGGVLYTSAGLWPSDGIYIYALDADTGEVKWVNDTAAFVGAGFVDSAGGNHQGEFIYRSIIPEGALLLSEGVLVVPQGHVNPARIDASTGGLWTKRVKQGEAYATKQVGAILSKITAKGDKPPVPEQLRRAKNTLANRGYGRPGSGGTWVTIDSGRYYVMAMHRNRVTYLNGWNIKDGTQWKNRHTDRDIPQLTREGLFRTVAPGRVSIVVKDEKIIGRNAYDLILAGDAIVQGHRGAVSLSDLKTDKEIWRAAVRGEARGLAAAGGRLIVSTDEGEITCFASGPGRIAKARAAATAMPVRPSTGDTALIKQIRSAGMDVGYGLVLGDTSGRLSRVLVEQTSLHIVTVLDGDAEVRALRELFLSQTSVYGSRLHVISLPASKKLPLTQYFANAVVAVDKDMTSPKELYRVLRPCGGILLVPGGTAVLKQTGAPAAEIMQAAPIPTVVRGQLPGANDYNNRVPDPLVKWPLQPLWFGGPDPDGLADDRSGEMYAKPPTAAYGRYMVQGATSVSAVDAYNGAVLWTRRMPKPYGGVQRIHGRLRNIKNVAPFVPVKKMHWRVRLARGIRISPDKAYVTMGPVYFNEAGSATVMLDVLTGQQEMFCGPYVQGPQISLSTPKTWILQIPSTGSKTPGKPGSAPVKEQDEFDALIADTSTGSGMDVASEEEGRRQMNAESGMLTMSADKNGLTIRLTTRDPAVSEFDIWELFFDFRPRAERYGLYDKGTFSLHVVPVSKGKKSHIVYRDEPHPEFSVSGKLTDGGTINALHLRWEEIEKIVDGKLESFDFAARIYADDTGSDYKKPVRMRQLFGLARPAGVNAGWATMWLGRVPTQITKPAIVHPLSDLPGNYRAPAALTGGRPDPAIMTAKRKHPLTGDMGPKLYRSGSWSCGGPAYSATCVFRRPSKPGIGVYDFEDDSGLRFIGGASSSCGSSAAAVLGLLIHSDSRFRCDCNPPMKTSVAFAPAEREYNEDWAIFFEREVNTRVKHASINLGAFGDRRDRGKKMWLAMPRDVDKGYGYALLGGQKHKAVIARDVGSYAKHVPAGLLVPAEIDFDESFGPYRRNSDRIVVKGTKRPWLYASGVSGIRKITMKLDFLDPIMTMPATDIVVDGRMGEKGWEGPAQITLVDTDTAILLRHDSKNLYIGMRRTPLIDRKGNPIGWTMNTAGKDADVWLDDSFELFFSDGMNTTVVHLGLSASGATYDARAAGEGLEDKKWNMLWHSAVVCVDGMTSEIAVPFASLKSAGLDVKNLGINVMVNKSDTRGDAHKWLGGEGRNWNLKMPSTEALGRLGTHGRARCSHFAPLGLGKKPSWPQRSFTVRLYFAELEYIEPGKRVFDVRIQGRTALKRFDIVKAAGGVRKAVAKGFKGVRAGETMTIEFIASKQSAKTSLPILSGFEILEETKK